MRTTTNRHAARRAASLLVLLLVVAAACSPSDESVEKSIKDWQAKLDAQWKKLISTPPTPLGSSGNPSTPVTTVKPPTKPSTTTTTVKRPSAQGGGTSATTTTAVSSPAPSGSVTWSDEFNGSTLDTDVWTPYYNTYGDGNNEMACLRPDNAQESGGTLRIVAQKESVTCPGNKARNYTSAFLGSREVGRYYPVYGRYEIRARLPHAQGLWPAFWLRHRNGAGVAEVDILEYFHSAHPGQSSGTLHLDGVHNVSQATVGFEPSSVTTSGWHTWAVEISPDPAGVRFEFFMDDQKYESYVDTKHAWLTTADPSSSWDIAVNMAVGGSWVGGPDDTLGYLRDVNRCSKGGSAPDGCDATGIRRANWADRAATTYEVDYVRVYTR